MYMSFSLLFWMFYELHICSSQNPEFISHPQSVNCIDGKHITFSCSVRNADLLLFHVNYSFADDKKIVEEGFAESSVKRDGGLLLRNLTALALIQYNNTIVSCRAIKFSQKHSFSKNAVLRIQGPLSSVGALSQSSINSTTVNISWSPPFTLPGTAITGYNISVTSNGTTTNYFTSDTYLLINSACTRINITISGYNGLNGETQSISGTYPPSDILSVSSIVATDFMVPSVEFVCNFYHDAESKGCQIELTLLIGKNYSFVMSADRFENKAVVTFNNIMQGVYHLVGFDVHCDDSITPAFEVKEITLLGDTSSSTESLQYTARILPTYILPSSNPNSIFALNTTSETYSMAVHAMNSTSEKHSIPVQDILGIAAGICGGLCVLVISILIYLYLWKKFRRKRAAVPVSLNPSYVNHRTRHRPASQMMNTRINRNPI